MDKLLNPLYMGLHIVNLIVLVYVLKLLLYKPVKKFMAARKAELEKETEQLDRTKEQLDGMRTELDDKNAEYNRRVKDDYNDAMHKAYDKAAAIVEKANREAQQILDNAALSSQAQADALLKQQHKAAASLAVDIAENILPRQLTEQDHLTLLEQSLKEAEQNGV